ncbi:hypothetical protein RvY_16731-2 [Ramazzottius varieornatus]|uniref:Uncharacterized protein n=1 Tax=Ramazzottius varieornatus TaxID=947166 RepID=A0A1D1VZK7_RAMVA|nr:hypothetical protein RvY_16731-2 [Ramazzottius varieornatus]
MTSAPAALRAPAEDSLIVPTATVLRARIGIVPRVPLIGTGCPVRPSRRETETATSIALAVPVRRNVQWKIRYSDKALRGWIMDKCETHQIALNVRIAAFEDCRHLSSKPLPQKVS